VHLGMWDMIFHISRHLHVYMKILVSMIMGFTSAYARAFKLMGEIEWRIPLRIVLLCCRLEEPKEEKNKALDSPYSTCFV